MYGSYIILDVLVYMCLSYVDYNLYISCIIDNNLQPICYYVHVYVRKHIHLLNSTFSEKSSVTGVLVLHSIHKMCVSINKEEKKVTRPSLLRSIYVCIGRHTCAACGSKYYFHVVYNKKDTNFNVLVNLYYQ